MTDPITAVASAAVQAFRARRTDLKPPPVPATHPAAPWLAVAATIRELIERHEPTETDDERQPL